MRIALISDIHANFEALNALQEDLVGVDRVVCLGDIIGYYCQVNEVVSTLRAWNAHCILGNHDWFLVNGVPGEANDSVRFGIEFADAVIDADHRAWLSGLPVAWSGRLARSFSTWSTGVHGVPCTTISTRTARSWNNWIASTTTSSRSGRRGPYLRDGARPRLINPGSVGQSRHKPNVACAVLMDTGTGECLPIERPYDPNHVIRLARSRGAGAWVERHFRGGV